QRVLGRRYYELKNHLGNVMTIISDDITRAESLTRADVVSVSDYYPFGLEHHQYYSVRQDRNEAAAQRYGFNGKERDNSFSASSVVYDYGFRIYNPSIGKFLSVDPLTASYPWYTPYQFAGNKPIWAVDLVGLEPGYFQLMDYDWGSHGGILEFVLYDYKSIEHKTYKQYMLINHIKKVDGKHIVDEESVLGSLKPGPGPERAAEYEDKVKQALMAIEMRPDYFDPDRKIPDFIKRAIKRSDEYRLQRDAENNTRKMMSAIESGKADAYIDISVGTGGLLLTAALYALAPETGSGSAWLAGFSGAYSLDQISGGIRTLEAIDSEVFDPETEYKFVRGLLTKQGGQNAGTVYDIGSIIVGGKGALQNIKNINGTTFRGILEAANAGLSSYSIGDTTLDL
ncbi:MAG: RHS repeat-associated core domain-containing protein, partial [Marinoscillum sp.]